VAILQWSVKKQFTKTDGVNKNGQKNSFEEMTEWETRIRLIVGEE